MDLRNSKLIVVMAIAFCVIISTMAYLGFRNAGRDLLERRGSTETADDRYPKYGRRYAQATHRDETGDEIRSLRKLRELVQVKDRLLHERTQQLKEMANQRDLLQQDLQQLQRQHDQLRRESNQTMNAFVELSSQFADSENETASVASEDTDPDATEPANTNNLDVEIDLIQWQIEQADQRIAELELTAFREIILSSEATQALVATGAAAVPALLDRLASEDPEVRQWAARVLGQIGPDASLAIEALIGALNDQNAGVRDSARIALDRIENRS